MANTEIRLPKVNTDSHDSTDFTVIWVQWLIFAVLSITRPSFNILESNIRMFNAVKTTSTTGRGYVGVSECQTRTRRALGDKKLAF